MLREIVEAVRRQEPVRGKWHIPKSTKEIVWCDASSIAMNVNVEIGGIVVEDATCLRKGND